MTRQQWDGSDDGSELLKAALLTTLDRRIIFAACQCARLALKYVPEGERRPIKVIETTEAWCHRKASKKQVNAAYAANACHRRAARLAHNLAPYLLKIGRTNKKLRESVLRHRHDPTRLAAWTTAQATVTSNLLKQTTLERTA